MVRPITKLKSIEDAAVKLFAEKGIANVTIKHIAREANCAEGALYRHYPSKEEMGWRLLKREVEKFAKLSRDILTSDKEYSKRVSEAITLFYNYFDDDPLLFSFTMLTQHNFPEKKTDELGENLPYNIMHKFIEKGIKDGAFHAKDSQLVTALVMGLVFQPPIHKARGRLDGELSDRSKVVCDAILRVLEYKKK